MTIETPAGTINQITPIREFVELTTITNAQYLLGIQNMSTGNGSKITFGNLITSLISGNANNKLVKGSDDKLFISTPVEIGTLSNLTTTNKNNLVAAINELNANMGSLSNLETTVTTNLVGAINSIAELTEPELLLDKVNQSKALVTGNVAGYQEELEQLKLMKRSTFDISKFEIIGSPAITNDGIINGLDRNNYLKTTILNFDKTKPFEILSPIFEEKKLDSAVQYIYQTWVSNLGSQGLRVYVANRTLGVYYKFEEQTSYGNISSANVIEIGVKYQVKIIFTGSEYLFKYRNVTTNSEWYNIGTGIIESSNLLFGDNTGFWFGYHDSDPYGFLNGTLDMKSFLTINNDTEIFNSNKEGIDILKSTDFTLVTNSMKAFVYDNHVIYADSNSAPTELYNADGTIHPQSASEWQIVTTTEDDITTYDVQYDGHSATYTSGSDISSITNPTFPFAAGVKIMADGTIVSGLNRDNYILKLINFINAKTIKIKGRFSSPEISTADRQRVFSLVESSGLTNCLDLSFNFNSRTRMIVHYSNSYSTETNSSAFDVSSGWHNFNLEIGNGLLTLNIDDTQVLSLANDIANYYKNFKLMFGTLGGNTGEYNGMFDLNAFEFYIDGKVAYQPCLRIPYFESSVQYGSKIVDAQYRDRVLNAYQQGYKDYKYYTLDEENGNFTLPHGELYGMLEQIRTENEQNNEAVRQIVDAKDNLYKILEGHQSTNKTLWDLITFTDNSEADNLLIGSNSPFTSNSSSSNFHFYLLNSTTGSSYNPDDTAKANIYKLFNKSHFDSQSDPIVVQDGTIVITCANPTKLSKILLRSYDTNTALPTIITVCGANITNNMSREIVSSDFSSAKYIGGISQTKEAAYNDPTSTNWGLNRPLELTIDDKDTFNTFFINMSYWYTPSGTARRLVGIKLYGTQMTNDDSDYTVKMSGEYENCKWIASNGNIHNTDDLYQQYGYIPKEKASLARWISCFGSGIGQANATTRAPEQYYPRYISGSISSTTLTSGQPWWVLRQTNYSAENRPQTGYNTSGGGYIQKNTTLNNQTVIDYTADSYFPVGEYYWEGIFGYNDASRGNCYLANWCQLQKVYDDDSVEIIQTFSKEGSMYESSVCYRTPRFYASRAFKKLRLIVQEENYPNNSFILSQMQLYYRDATGTIARSFIPSATQYDLSYNTVKHKSNIHFFITPTGVRVGSNCFIQKTDPTIRAACVGNRWINENTKKSYVCNTSGVWTEEDFCEIGCMTMFGSKHVGMRLRTVANSENPMQKYIQDYEDIGGNLALNYNMVSNTTTVITTSPTDPDYYFQAEAADENAGVVFYMPANTVTIQAMRRALTKSKIYQSGQQFAHYSNSSRMGAVLMAYKTFDTSAAGEYIEGSEEEEQ